MEQVDERTYGGLRSPKRSLGTTLRDSRFTRQSFAFRHFVVSCTN